MVYMGFVNKNPWLAAKVVAVGIIIVGCKVTYKLIRTVWFLFDPLKHPDVHIITTPNECMRVLSLIQADVAIFRVLGYDCRHLAFMINGVRQPRPMPLLQLATHSGRCALFNVSDPRIADQLRELLYNWTIIKVTVGPRGYAKPFLRCFKLEVTSTVDLAKRFDLVPKGQFKFYETMFGMELNEDGRMQGSSVVYEGKTRLLCVDIYKKLLDIYHEQTAGKELPYLNGSSAVNQPHNNATVMNDYSSKMEPSPAPYTIDLQLNPPIQPKVHIITTLIECRRVLSLIQADLATFKVLGFDCEWVTKNNVRQPVALLQLATHSGLCALFRLSHLNPSMPAELKMLLEDETVLKGGVDPLNDANNLLKDYDVRMKSTLDLRYLAVYLGEAPHGLAKMAKAFVGVELNKNRRITCSLWDCQVLTEAQVDYAAKDGLVAIEIYKTMVDIFRERNNYMLYHRYLNKPFKYQRRNHRTTTPWRPTAPRNKFIPINFR